MFDSEEEQELSPELKDILEMIKRYSVSNPESCFVYNFIGFKKIPDTHCDDCGEECDEIDLSKSQIGAFGNLNTIRQLNNMIRDVVEDGVDEYGFVNV